MTNRYLVTGGAGFIGTHLCKYLLEKDYEVICIDNFFTGRKKFLHSFLDNKNFELIRHDITEPIRLEVDKIFNLACPASPIHYQFNAIETVKTNVMGTMNMLDLAKRIKARFLQASTSEVYGDPKEHPQKETYWGNVNPIGLRSCYDEGKRVAETLTMDYHRMNGVDVRIIRIFNSYGPLMLKNDGRVISNFIVQALTNQNITINGDGSQTRCFCYIDDLIQGIVAVMEMPEFIGPINLGNPIEISILDLANKIIQLTHSSSKIVFQPLPVDDPVRRKPDITLAKEKLNYSPKISLEKGLLKTIEFFDHLLKK